MKKNLNLLLIIVFIFIIGGMFSALYMAGLKKQAVIKQIITERSEPYSNINIIVDGELHDEVKFTNEKQIAETGKPIEFINCVVVQDSLLPLKQDSNLSGYVAECDYEVTNRKTKKVTDKVVIYNDSVDNQKIGTKIQLSFNDFRGSRLVALK